MNFFQRLSQAEWERVKHLGYRRYIWSEHALPVGLPLGIMIAVERYAQLGLSWNDLFTRTGMAVAYFSIAASMVFMGVWGLLAWHHQKRRFERTSRPDR